MSNQECDFEVLQGGLKVASGTGPHDSAVAEAMHYAPDVRAGRAG